MSEDPSDTTHYPSVWYVCKFCHRAFPKKGKLKRHKRDFHDVMNISKDETVGVEDSPCTVSLRNRSALMPKATIVGEEPTETVAEAVAEKYETDSSSATSSAADNQNVNEMEEEPENEEEPELKTSKVVKTRRSLRKKKDSAPKPKQRRSKKIYYSAVPGRSYRCKYCKKSLVTGSSLNHHLLKYHEDEVATAKLSKLKFISAKTKKTTVKKSTVPRPPKVVLKVGSAIKTTTTKQRKGAVSKKKK